RRTCAEPGTRRLTAALRRNCEAVALSDAGVLQLSGDALRRAQQLGVGEAAGGRAYGDAVRVLRRALREYLHDTGRADLLRRRIVPSREQRTVTARGQLELTQSTLRLRSDRLEDLEVVSEHAL